MGESTAAVVVDGPISPKSPHPSGGGRPDVNQYIALVSYISSLPLLGYGMWLMCTKNFRCGDHLGVPDGLRFWFGLGLIAVFVASCLFTHYGDRILYLGAGALASTLLVMLLFGIILLGSYAMESRSLPVSPVWMRMRVATSDTWTAVKNCIYSSALCHDLAFRNVQLTADQFNSKDLNPLESGCCKPPDICGMEYVNATYWKRPQEDTTSPTNSTTFNPKTFGDCLAYSNIDTYLCYDCHSCKEGVIKSIHREWKKVGAFLISMSVILLAIHTVRFVLAMVRNKIDVD